MLKELVVQYEKAVFARREANEKEGSQTMNTENILSGSQPT